MYYDVCVRREGDCNAVKRKFTPTKAIVIAVIALVSGVIVFFAAVTAALFIGVENAAEESATLQSKRLDELERAYADGTAPKISEADICAFDLSCAIADGVRINNLQYIATHNSYKAVSTAVPSLFMSSSGGRRWSRWVA